MTVQAKNAVSALRSRVDNLSDDEALRVIAFIDALTAYDAQLAAMDEFINAIKASNEEVPEFERIKLREVEI